MSAEWALGWLQSKIFPVPVYFNFLLVSQIWENFPDNDLYVSHCYLHNIYVHLPEYSVDGRRPSLYR